MHWTVFVNPLALCSFIWYSMGDVSQLAMIWPRREETV
jgi:hypothetical protein